MNHLKTRCSFQKITSKMSRNTFQNKSPVYCLDYFKNEMEPFKISFSLIWSRISCFVLADFVTTAVSGTKITRLKFVAESRESLCPEVRSLIITTKVDIYFKRSEFRYKNPKQLWLFRSETKMFVKDVQQAVIREEVEGDKSSSEEVETKTRGSVYKT